jgi:hypothetical protein
VPAKNSPKAVLNRITKITLDSGFDDAVPNP